ncbi:MAG: long-chain fatty acid--CoA ligase [Candidatus Dormibacteria bacterium]
MLSTMPDAPLTVLDIFRRGRGLFARSEAVTFTGTSSRHATFVAVGERAARLAAGLRHLGVGAGDRVATLCWNHQEHLEAYLAVPCMGAVLHTLNLRLAPDRLAYVINHAADRVVIVDAGLAPLLASIRSQLTTVEKVVVIGEVEALGLGEMIGYEDLLAARPPVEDWPELDERQAAAMCYTTGTTGDPRGVVYSHRSIWLHSHSIWVNFELRDQDRLLVTVPMFHVNAWGTPYAAWMTGTDLLLPDRHLKPELLLEFIGQQRPTFVVGVPSVFQGLLTAAEAVGADLGSIRRGICGGSAVPVALMKAYEPWFPLIQAWGMTETSPMGTIAVAPRGMGQDDAQYWHYRSTAGRPVAGVELRITGEAGEVLPWDGQSVGEIEVRGPWITAGYLDIDASDRLHDGWLRTGDAGTVDARGYVQITDRIKDVIKSGGEWISSVELETLLAGHPAVLDAAVVGIPDERWSERPLAVVALEPGSAVRPAALRRFLEGTVPSFWLPEAWAVVDEIPVTSVGKRDKQAIRALLAQGRLEVTRLDR